MWSYRNPVEICFGEQALERAGGYLSGSRYALVTYAEPLFEAALERIVRGAGRPHCVLTEISENPDIGELAAHSPRFKQVGDGCDVIVALGGGSVLDAAKAIALTRGDTARLRALPAIPDSGGPALPIVAIPTTAGTGSEVTCWATMWDRANGRKLSLEHASLFPRAAFIDPGLTLSAPRSLTVATGLDALSHALESVWNINANPVSRAAAVEAARTILRVLPDLADNLDDLDLRTRMAEASVLAGLAFSSTRTALAHNISYPITLNYGVPHGIACSFTLPMVMRWAGGADKDCDATLEAIFGADIDQGAEILEALLNKLGVSTDHRDYQIATESFNDFIAAGAEGQRGRNFLGKVPAPRALAASDSAAAAAGYCLPS